MGRKRVNERGNMLLLVSVIVIAVVLCAVMGYMFWSRQNITTAIATCTSLSLSQGGSSGAAGTIYKNADITNTGTANCTVTGYPAVFMLDSGNTQVGNGAVADSLYVPVAITLVPNGKAHTVVAYPQQPNFPAGSCSAIGSTMKLYVPGLAAALTTSWSDYSCPGFSATAFQPGA